MNNHSPALSSSTRPGGQLLHPPGRAALSFFCALSFFATACTKHETAVAAGIRTQTLLVGNGDEPRDLDPHLSMTMGESNLMSALFEGLTCIDEAGGQPVPGVADKW